MILNLYSTRFKKVSVLAAFALAVAACGGTESSSDETETSGVETTETADSPTQALTALATTTIWADITSNALCDAPVESIIPSGADPHSFEPSVRVPEDIAAANLLVRNGLFLEEGLLATLDSVDETKTTVVSVASLVETYVMAGDEDHADHDDHGDEDHADHDDHGDEDHADHDDHGDEDHADHDDHDDHGHDHSAGDPHFWLDPVVVAEAVRGIASAAVDAGWPESVEACATAYAEELTALDEEIAAAVSAIEPDSRLLVTNHDAFGYFADRYGFTVLGTILPSTSTLAEANPADLAELAEKVQETGVTAIFYDLQASSADAQAFADRLDGIQAISLLSGALVEDAEIGADYLTMMRTNVDRIVAGLSN